MLAGNADFQMRDWLVEPDLNQISRDGHSITLEPQTMAVLVMLAERAGDPIASDVIIERVWDGRPMADNPLYKAVTKLRHALGDDARAPEYIETISKKGYRLIAPVIRAPDWMPDVAEAGTQAKATKKPGPTKFVALYIVAALVVIWFLLWVTQPQPVPDAHTVTKLVNLPGSNYAPSFDSVGSRAVFVNERPDGASLWVLDLNSNALRRVVSTHFAPDRPAWRPDSETILFNSQDDIWASDASGIDPFVLIENASNAAWSPSGEALVFERNYEVWVARADGLGQRRINDIESRQQMFVPREPSYSPDGRQLVYFEATQGPVGHIMLYSFETRETTMVVENAQIAGAPVFTPDGKFILFHSAISGRTALWRIGLEPESTARMVLPGTSDDRQPVPIIGTAAVAYSSTRDTFQLVSTDVTSGNETVLYESRTSVAGPALSSDNSKLAFFGLTDGGGANIFVTRFDDQPAQQLTKGVGSHVMPKWSRDSQWIYHYYVNSGVFMYQRLHVESGTIEQVFETANFNQHHDISIDPTGGLALYALIERDKVLDTYLRDIDSGAEFALGERLSWFDWAADGKRFVATELSGGEFPVGSIVLCELEDVMLSCQTLADRGQHPVWTGKDEIVHFVEPVGSDLKLWAIDVETKQTEYLRTLGPTINYGPFVEVTPDGKALWVRHIAGQSELWRWNPNP